MAGETAHFNLRNREPTPAVRPFAVSPRLKSMLDRAHSALAEPFRGITEGTDIVPGLFARERTGVSLAFLLEVARSFLAALTPKQREAGCFAIDDDAWRRWSLYAQVKPGAYSSSLSDGLIGANDAQQ